MVTGQNDRGSRSEAGHRKLARGTVVIVSIVVAAVITALLVLLIR